MPSIDTRVGRLCYERAGSGPAVLFWHSWLADSALWEAQAEDLSRDHHVLLVDGPCHGKSAVVPDFTLEDCAHAVIEILDAHGIERAILAGSSWGGMTAMRVALQAPHRVKGLALFSTTAETEGPLQVFGCRVFAELMTRGVAHSVVAEVIQHLMFGRTTLREKPHLVQWGLRRLRALDRAGHRAATRAIVFERRAILHELPKIRVPTLVAVGAEDLCLPPSRSRRIANAIPGARFELVQGAGHLLPIEAPHVVNRLLREFVTSVHERTPEQPASVGAPEPTP